ncbi:HAD-IIB family hydrolase [Longibaculum muris]|uniref:HAD-IIB family hydrolase n=1 Tax=Longibaculum muris TaxID=1796628 RepID=UPI00189F6EA6|nr:HAD-IIB family hydrolase [Longibaculum muris]
MKLLASDFDNTLWFNDHMKEEDVKAILAFQKQENLFGVCSGRCLHGIVNPSLPYHLDHDFYILLSGALILNKDKEVIFERQIPLSLVQEIYDFVEHIDMSIVYNDTMYKIYQVKKNDYHGVELDSLNELQTDMVSAFSFHYELDQIDQATLTTQKILAQFGDVIEAYQNNQHIDLVAKGCSKGHGMQIIQDYFDLSPKDIYGIGDSWNDLPMLDAIENGYTFTYAPKEVKKHAKKVVTSVAECIYDIKNIK